MDKEKISFKENIKKYYNEEAGLRNSKSVKAEWKVQVRENFYNLTEKENKKTLLELGAGAGYDSRFFMDMGMDVVAVDISQEMVRNCREKSIEAYELDFYNLSSLNKNFDCIYAINTLLHVPKADLPLVLKQIDSVLNPDGLFFMGLYGGEDTENMYVKSDVSDAPRLFSFYSEAYLKNILSDYFKILSFDTIELADNDCFHSVILRKKEV